MRLSYFCSVNSFTGNTTSLYWICPQIADLRIEGRGMVSVIKTNRWDNDIIVQYQFRINLFKVFCNMFQYEVICHSVWTMCQLQ